MDYRTAVKRFKAENPDLHKGSGIDYWTAWERWDFWTDALCKAGEITLKQYSNWATPFEYGKRL